MVRTTNGKKVSIKQFRLGTGAVKQRGKLVGGTRLDPQQRARVRAKEAKLVRARGPSGFALRPTAKGKKLSGMRLKKLSL